MKTRISFNSATETVQIDLDSEDATTQTIAQAAIDLLQSRMSMSEGDSITVTEVDE